MTPEQLDEIFHQTLADSRLSRGERKALSQILADERPDASQLAVFRHQAFAVAGEHLHDPRDRQIVEWLSGVMKLLLPPDHDQTVAEARFSPGQDCVHRVISLFAHARQSAQVCVFTITDDRIADAMIEAHGRGLRIRVITDNMKALDRGSDIERLRRAGLEVLEDRSEHHMHHKFALFDERLLLTGSFNWTRSATVYNQENVVITSELRLVRAFRDAFAELWEKFR